MVNIVTAFPSKYLRAADLDGEEPTYTIKAVTMEQIEAGQPGKPVLHFNEIDKGIVLNKTNARTIAKLYGAETDEWEGRPVQLFMLEVDFRGEMVESIRVRGPKKRKPEVTQATAKKPAPADLDDEVPF